MKACKQTHPDANRSDDDLGDHSQRFMDIEDAYQKLKQHIKARALHKQIEDEPSVEDEQKNCGPKVAQHRQYLSMDGVGVGTPTERLKQYDNYRLTKATNRVNEFNLNKIRSCDNWSQENALIIKEANLQREIKTKQGFERLVEDLIQESMAKGDFNNLTGYGKPLKNRPEYPYLDSTTFKLNEILINNGFVPEWLLLEKEIRDEKNQLKAQLLSLRSQSKLNNVSLVTNLLNDKVIEVNKKIDKYNRIVPIFTKQQIHVILEKEIKKVLKSSDISYDQRVSDQTRDMAKTETNKTSKLSDTSERKSPEVKVDVSDNNNNNNNNNNVFRKLLSFLS